MVILVFLKFRASDLGYRNINVFSYEILLALSFVIVLVHDYVEIRIENRNVINSVKEAFNHVL